MAKSVLSEMRKQRLNRIPTFTDKSEEQLRKELFESDVKAEDDEESPYFEEVVEVHKKRPDQL